MDAKERQIAEIEFVSAAYTPDEAWVSYDRGSSLPVIHRILTLPIRKGVCPTLFDNDCQVCIQLHLTMPEGYLTSRDGTLQVDASISKETSNCARKIAVQSISKLLNVCRQVSLECAGEEAVFSVLTSADEWANNDWPELLSAIEQVDSNSCEMENHLTSLAVISKREIVLGRRLIYSHHIIAKTKRRQLADLAGQYDLGGYVKIGWPGIILIEGYEDDCIQYVDEIRSWRWQHLVVRGEEQIALKNEEELHNQRKLPRSFQELGERQMSDLANICKQANLEELFLTSMKIYRNESVKVENQEIHENTNEVYGILVHVDHMNDVSKYRKWLKKTCKLAECSLLLKKTYINDNPESKPLIFVGIVGNQDATKQVMKRWRSSRVDVDSKGRPCLERMSKIVSEGLLTSFCRNKFQEFENDNEFTINYEKLMLLLQLIGKSEWLNAFNLVSTSFKGNK